MDKTELSLVKDINFEVYLLTKLGKPVVGMKAVAMIKGKEQTF